MFDKTMFKEGAKFALFATVYVTAIALVMTFAADHLDEGRLAPLAPTAFLLMLVLSAATMGALIFGKPVMLYLDGKKREAVALLISTIGSLAVITILYLLLLSTV
jgi:hypothetical protein